jgi:tetratricopeptide (TPR) repeat protein
MKVRTSFGIVFGICVFVAAPLQAQDPVTALNEAAWARFNKGDSDGAATLFAQALTLRPADPVLLLGAGASAHKQGRPADAMERLHRALDVNPRFTAASRLLGEIAYSEGDVDLAISTYEKALAHAPADAALAARLNEWRAASSLAASKAPRVAAFTVTLEGRMDQALAERAADHLEQALSLVEHTLRAAPEGELVVELDTDEPVAGTVRAPDWSEATYSGRIRVPAEGALRTPVLFERLLAHEVAHAMISSLVPRGIPAWLHEGLAQHFAGDDSAAARRRIAAAGRTIPMARLEDGFVALDGADAQLAYDQSLLAVQPLLQRNDFGWGAFFSALESASSVGEVLARFGFTYAQLEASFLTGPAARPYRTSQR